MKSGIGASSGIGIGKVLILDEPDIVINSEKISGEELNNEISKFKDALKKSVKQLDDIKHKSIANSDEEAIAIIEAHMMLVEDPTLSEEIESKIKDEEIRAEYGLKKIIDEKVKLFESFEDEYLRERANDIRDIGDRILRNILDIPYKNISKLDEDVILVGRDITPSQMATIDKVHVKGIITEIGGKTCHTAILARNMDIPAVLGIKGIVKELKEGSFIAVNGTEGFVEVELSDNKLSEYREKIEKLEAFKRELQSFKEKETITKDGKKVELYANIVKPEDTEKAMENGAEGVGLFRTEFLFMDRNNLPSEEEQYEAYKRAAEGMEGRPIIIRTIDIGGDKDIPYLNLPKEENPFLGFRAIRICFEEEKLFKTQLRAILRASVFGKVKIMYPMISGVQEVKKANKVLDAAKSELRKENKVFDEDIEVGIMIEIPSAALTADLIIEEVDFFSIGTNDLTQYTLAADRMNEKVGDIYNSFHPAVLRLIKNVIDVSHRSNKFTGMCGEFAGNPISTILLLGMGLDEFSMNASSILKIRKIISSVDMDFAQTVVENVMKLSDPNEIENYLKEVSSRFINN
ncbi:phosphoenolpyruvate--protein phosphotransferase [Wukongibacter baidiensis]|uniref:phosphoenolpyruvate--protein phosphotransferase n=1 Tax=Wukongibacter baidiensis TaxID=1723361 RepID=UPI003D7FE179